MAGAKASHGLTKENNMAETKERMKRACPSMRELADRIDNTITLLNELKTDYNANLLAVTTKLNLVIARTTEDLAAQYTAHRAASHPDSTNVLTTSAVTNISTTDNTVSSPSVDPV